LYGIIHIAVFGDPGSSLTYRNSTHPTSTHRKVKISKVYFGLAILNSWSCDKNFNLSHARFVFVDVFVVKINFLKKVSSQRGYPKILVNRFLYIQNKKGKKVDHQLSLRGIGHSLSFWLYRNCSQFATYFTCNFDYFLTFVFTIN
jgi:hypothetical protein